MFSDYPGVLQITLNYPIQSSSYSFLWPLQSTMKYDEATAIIEWPHLRKILIKDCQAITAFLLIQDITSGFARKSKKNI